MYDVSDAYKKAIVQDFQEWKAEVRVRYANGEQKVFDDNAIKDGITIDSQMMSCGSGENVIDVGAVPAKTVRLTLIDDSTDLHRYAGARISIHISLKLENGEYERIPMGAFFVDSSALSRVDNKISIVGHDGMLSFQYALRDDHRAALKSKNATEAARLLAAYSACGFSQDLSQLPNGNIPLNFDSTQIETAWDGIMWIAQIMGCFGRINRQNYLEFVPIMSEWEWFNEDHTWGTIIAARNIEGDQRYDEITYTDDRIHIVGVAMKGDDDKLVTRGGGGLIDDANITINLEKNPIIAGCGKTLEAILDDILEQLSTAYFYAFRSVIKNDPSLDAGDVIRLRGGRISGTNKNNDLIGFITHSTWEYHGRQTITNVGQVPIVYRDASDAAALSDDNENNIALLADGQPSDELFYVPPIPQSQKAKVGNAIKTAIIVSQYTSEYMQYEYTVLPVTTFPVLYGGSTSNSVICCGLVNGCYSYSKESGRAFDENGKLLYVDYTLGYGFVDAETGEKITREETRRSWTGEDSIGSPDGGTVTLQSVVSSGGLGYGFITVQIVFKWSGAPDDPTIWKGIMLDFKNKTELDAALGLTTEYVQSSEVNVTATKMGGEFTPGSIPVDLN